VELPKRELPSLVGCGAKPCEKVDLKSKALPCALLADRRQ
jgi:hypothetical protein